MQTKTLAIREEISKVIVGKDEVIAKVLMAILSGGHVLLDDVPGWVRRPWPFPLAKL